MKRFLAIVCLAALTCLSLLAGGCGESKTSADKSAPKGEAYTPREHQPGKDVVWVPTPDALVAKMLDMAKVTSSDYVVDLGSGDGRLVIGAAGRGAAALGIEYNTDLVDLAKRAAAKAGVTAKASFENADLFEKDFSQATVITMYLLPQLNLDLRPKILAMKPGTRVVSHAFNMAKWQPDRVEAIDIDGRSYTAYLWIVPAKVDGVWKLDDGQIAFEQEFQKLTGVMGKDTPLTGRLDGDKIFFEAGGKNYSGTVNGNTLSGTIAGGGAWKAVRE